AGAVELGTGDRILGEAVDVERGTPLVVTRTLPHGARVHRNRLMVVTRRVELHLHERGASVSGEAGVVVGGYVAVAVRRARREVLLRIGLRVAHRHAEPERGMQLEVVRVGRAGR